MRMTLIWIGGSSIPGAGTNSECNSQINPGSAQYIFSKITVPIWQIGDAAYCTCMVSDTELQMYVAPCGKVGARRHRKVSKTSESLGRYGADTGETWTFGDTPPGSADRLERSGVRR